jgi:hypothetical protein
VASNPPEPAGPACTTNGGSRCNGSGTAPACVQCLVATDCPGADTECQVRACTAGVCGFTNINNGNPVLAQIPGDCMKSVCNAGVATPQTDITDVPVDNNPCTQDVCTGGTPSNPPSPSGTTCNVNSGSVCNGTGACVQCVLASNCPGGPDTACKTRTCSVGGTCGFSFAGSGTLVTNAPLGNCQKDVCDGAGSVTTVVDDTDVPFDANACTQDLCTTGTPTNPPELAGTPPACSA